MHGPMNIKHIIISAPLVSTPSTILMGQTDRQTGRPSFIMIQTKDTTTILCIYVNRHNILHSAVQTVLLSGATIDNFGVKWKKVRK
jgi:hypothetical protein